MKNEYPCKPQFYHITVGCKGVFISRTCFMEGDLSKKSIHINESFVHAIYIGIVVNS